MESNPLRIEDCFVSQQGLRNVGQLVAMVEFIKDGGRFNPEGLKPPGAPLIHIVRFEDGQLYIQDGHHRMCAMVLADRPFLWPDEYWIEDWKYEQYLEVNTSVNWVTPYDPRTEVRYPDYSEYKAMVREIPEVTIEGFIQANRNQYCCQRNFYHIRALVDRMDLYYLSSKVQL